LALRRRVEDFLRTTLLRERDTLLREREYLLRRE
jgi:hypothetical protein